MEHITYMRRISCYQSIRLTYYIKTYYNPHRVQSYPMLPVRLPNTPRELAHNPSGACSQPLASKRPRGCEQAAITARHSPQRHIAASPLKIR